MKLQEEITQQIKSLLPFVERAGRTHKMAQEEWDRGIKTHGGAAQYKSTETYKMCLKNFDDAQKQIGQIVKDLNAGLKEKNSAMIVKALAYLKIKDRHFRSGYMKEEICRNLTKIELNNEEKEALQEIIIEQIDAAGREFGSFLRFVPKIYSETFRVKVLESELKYTQQPETSKIILKRFQRIKEFFPNKPAEKRGL